MSEPRIDAAPWWYPPLRRPRTRQEAALGAALSFVLLILAAYVTKDVWRDSTIALTWPRANATVSGDPQPGPRVNKRGYPYELTLRVTLPDGREVTGYTLKPVFSSFTPSSPPPGGHIKAQPHSGDRLPVHIDPNAPERMMPREALFPFWWAAFMFAVSGGSCWYFVHHLRQQQPS